MFKNVGKLIGFYRKQKLDSTKDPKYTQVNFIKYEHRDICSQSKLSDLENGKIKIPYPDEYQSLIKNLDFIPIDYIKVKDSYDDFVNRLLYRLQYKNTESLNSLIDEFDTNLLKYDSYFYLHELNEIIKFTFNHIKGISLPNAESYEFYLDSIQCYNNDIQCLILNLAYIILENYNPSISARERITSLIESSKLSNPLIQILKATLHFRQSNFKRVNKILSLIDIEKLNDYSKFKIERLQFMMKTERVFHPEQLSLIHNPSKIYNDVNRFELCRPYLHIATLYYSFKEYFLAIEHYQESIRINSEVSCLNLIYIFDCLYELNRLNEFENYSKISDLHLNKFTQLHRDIREFCLALSNNFSTILDSAMLNSLITNLSILNKESPYIYIIRKHLLLNIAMTHKYRIIYDFEKTINNTK